MVTCPWCGTNYVEFRPNCYNCGGKLPLPEKREEKGRETESERDHVQHKLAAPPPAPRQINNKYIWRLMLGDGWVIGAMIFILVGGIFTFIGAIVTITIVVGLVGIIFLGIGVPFLFGGLWVTGWRFGKAKKTVQVLREGEAVIGHIVQVDQNYSVQVNGRHPWVIDYQFNGQYRGRLITLKNPGPALQAGQDVYVLYLPHEPEANTIYPHP